jgi:hypothetical protein
MDRIDRRLLEVLQEDSQASISVLAEKIGLSPRPAIAASRRWRIQASSAAMARGWMRPRSASACMC